MAGCRWGRPQSWNQESWHRGRALVPVAGERSSGGVSTPKAGASQSPDRSSPFVSSGRVIGYHYYLCCYYWLQTTETDCLVVLQSRSLKSRRGQGRTLSEACRGVLCGFWLASDGLLAISNVPWLVGASPQSLCFSKLPTV